MSRRIFFGGVSIFVCVCISSLFFLNAVAEEKEASNPTDAKQLLKRIEILEKRITLLEKGQSIVPVSYQTLTQPLQQVPQEWQRREINGHQFYIVPLANKKISR